MMNLRTPLAQARGLGSAKDGVHHWWVQRMTAVALIPMSLWFLFSVAVCVTGDLEQARAWLANPFNAVLAVLWLATMFHHSQLGCQVVIEDYVHHDGLKLSGMILMKFAHVLAAAVAIFSVLKIAFLY